MTKDQKEQKRNRLYGQKECHGEDAKKLIGMLRDMELQFMIWDALSRKLMENFCDAIKNALEEMDTIHKKIEALRS